MFPVIGKDYSVIVVPLIDAAKKSIDLCVYDWRFYPNRPEHPVSLFNQALIRAARRGVRVRALLNSALILPILREQGILAATPRDHRVLHTKFILIDDSDLVIGSHNFTSNAFTSNLECSVYAPGCPAVPRFAEFFNNLYGMS